MPSLIPGFEYDIFLSYRQKDNKHNGWVTEFVDNLKGELESTFKEEISVYFDINPHDGLLETHDVDASLKEKLKCLVFIPIISRTYCDPKSFAWVHEFKAFIEQAAKDQFGLKVKLPGGNVASRILPVQIHDLDADDKMVVENELGGFLRRVEFIYKEPGVNRPLTPNDDEKKNLNNTLYKNQINKVANAIKEIITGLKSLDQKGKESSKEIIEEKPSTRKNLKTRIIAGSLLLIAAIVAGYFIVSKLIKPEEQLEKSIAVLPFINNSLSDSNKYFINGIMEEVLNNLMKIKDFRVLSRTSTDQYKGPDRPTMPEIAKKLGVNYIVEGSGQKFGNTFILRIQLIAAKNKEKHLWAERYEQEIKEVKDFIGIQSQIAQAIASELQAVITPEETLLIKKTSTANLTAYDFYQRGREEYVKYSTTGNREALKKAENLYHEALKYDSTFAQAYIGLATVYKMKHYWSDYFSKDFMDSVLILTDIALSYDDQSAEAYTIRGAYYSEIGKPELTLKEIDKAIKLNPNDWSSYLIKAQNSGNDIIEGIENYYKVLSLNRGSELPNYLRSISQLFLAAGFIDKAKYYLQEALKLDDDSLTYYLNLSSIETWSGNHIKGLEYAKKIYAIDSTNMDNLHLLGHLYMFLHQYEESLKYFKKYIESLRAKGNLNLLDMESLGFAYWQIGNKKEAESYFNREIDYCNKAIDLGRSFGNIGAYYELADIYAIKGEKDKAFKNLRIFWQKQELVAITEQVIYVHILKNDPMFDNLRNEPEFQQIVREVDAKYQAEHERVGKWMKEQMML